jgi:predicted mannosyl-3-phosphoglycerate phosphatase (HAD superfamily)
MMGTRAWLLFADVDGTLWCGSERRQVLVQRMARARARAHVVLASSRTVEELLELTDRLGAPVDLIAENGAQVAVREQGLARALGADVALSHDGHEVFLRCAGASIPDFRADLAQVARRHGLSRILSSSPGWPGPAQAAAFRRASVLLPRAVFADGAHGEFLEELRMLGLDATPGGEWTSISRGSSKGEAAGTYVAAYRAWSGASVATAAVGNSDNDASLMGVVDRAFVIRNPEGYAPALAGLPNAVRLRRPACAGWYEAVARLEQQEGP